MLTLPGRDSIKCSQSRNVSRKSTVLSRLSSRVYDAPAGSPYPKKTSCSQTGRGTSARARLCIVSSIFLKLFSRPFRRTIILMDSYTSGFPVFVAALSLLYAAASSLTNSFLKRGLPTYPLFWFICCSLIIRPFSSRSCTISAVLNSRRPEACIPTGAALPFMIFCG